jgi:hypothetical protein
VHSKHERDPVNTFFLRGRHACQSAIALAMITIAFASAVMAAGKLPQASAGEALTFKLVYCGVGFASSGNAYEASDGTVLTGSYHTYRNARVARREFTKARKLLQDVEIGVDDRPSGEPRRELVWGTVPTGQGRHRVVLLILKGDFVSRIEAASREHIVAFRSELR